MSISLNAAMIITKEEKSQGNKMSDRFRKTYHQLVKENSDLIIEMKSKAEELDALFSLVPSREMSLAVTNLEQAMMWATKAVVLQDEHIKEPIRK
ncbi:TPA: hypothetical protein JAG59_002007 [Legionella pneumophila]|nr:hypothetical protein [Legionella pneumophila]HAT5918701.1 hypothetical protein [Legionella pneumophila]HAT5922946.1 hypothetical protein [Legionella pneumophila]HAT5934472.1 hypothetical protein [Legionella pneumophila]HAT5950224.1 hypothetical protein [Legionella pneumophila]